MSAPNDSDTWRTGYHQVLLKEVAHHFAKEDRGLIFSGLFAGLVPNQGPPSLLLITRPQRDIDYPLWNEAREVWAQNQPSLEQFVSELQQAGFAKIEHSIEAYLCSVALDQWQAMIKARFWSTFANFTDTELEEACDMIATNERHRIEDGIIRFEDRLLFITASKV